MVPQSSKKVRAINKLSSPSRMNLSLISTTEHTVRFLGSTQWMDRISVDHSPGTHQWRIVQPLKLGVEEEDGSPDWKDVLEHEVWADCIPENSLSRLWFVVPCE